MMKLRRGNILALAIGEKGISCAVVSGGGARGRTVHKLAYFASPEGISLERAGAIGAELKEFLQKHSIHETDAVLGVPAKWVIAQDRELPPVDVEEGYAMLRLHAERIATGDHGDLVFDVAGQSSKSQATRVLLVGMLRQQLERIGKLCEAAGLQAKAVMPTSLAVSNALGKDERALLVLSQQSAEIVWRPNGSVRMLRHLTAADAGSHASLGAVGSELRRAYTLNSAAAGAGREVLMWNDQDLPREALNTLSERSGLQVEASPSLESIGASVAEKALNGETGRMRPESFLPAIALGVAGTASRGETGNLVDLLHPRLAAPKKQVVSRDTLMAIATGVGVIVLISMLYFTAIGREQEAAELEKRVDDGAKPVKAAQERIDQFMYGRTYFQSRGPVLECMKEITAAFRPNETIWTSDLSLKEDPKLEARYGKTAVYRGQLRGKASGRDVVLRVQDRLRANPNFDEVQMIELRDSTGQTRDMTFSISFIYKGGK